ncbi:MAG: hypothetical protein RSC65_03865 [Malacoplasma sp.]
MNKSINKEREYDTHKGEEWTNRYNTMLDDVLKRKAELEKEISICDLEKQDILHYIEMKKCDAVMSSRLMKKLKEIITERRTLKVEYNAISSISALSKKSKYINNESYGFKTNVIVDLLEKIKGEW